MTKKSIVQYSAKLAAAFKKGSLVQGYGVIADQSLYSATNFLTGVLLARILSKEDYGIYVLALSYMFICLGIQRAIISTPFTINIPKYRDGERPAYIGSVLMHEFLFLGVVLVGSLLFSLAFLKNDYHNRFYLTACFYVALSGLLLRDFVRSYLLASLEIRASVFMGVFINVMQLSVLFILFAKHLLAIDSSFLIIGGCSFVPALFIFYLSSDVQIIKSSIMKEFISNLKMGKWILGSNIISTVSSQMYPWLLSLMVSKSSVATLGVAMSLANVLGPLQQGIYSFILPKMTNARRKNVSDVVKTMKKSMWLLLVLYGFWLFTGIYCGNYLLVSIFSQKYSGITLVLNLLILNSLIAGILVPVTALLEALERPDVSFRSQCWGLAVTLIIGVFLIHGWGLYGAIISILLSSSVNLIVRLNGAVMVLNDFKVSMFGPLVPISIMNKRR